VMPPLPDRPCMLEVLCLADCRRLDLHSLAPLGLAELRTLELATCRDVSGVALLLSLPRLRAVGFVARGGASYACCTLASSDEDHFLRRLGAERGVAVCTSQLTQRYDHVPRSRHTRAPSAPRWRTKGVIARQEGTAGFGASQSAASLLHPSLPHPSLLHPSLPHPSLPHPSLLHPSLPHPATPTADHQPPTASHRPPTATHQPPTASHQREPRSDDSASAGAEEEVAEEEVAEEEVAEEEVADVSHDVSGLLLG